MRVKVDIPATDTELTNALRKLPQDIRESLLNVDIIDFENDGPRVVRTTYFETLMAERGFLHLSVNAGAFRLLVPRAAAMDFAEMRTAEYVVVTQGAWTPPPVPQPDGTRRMRPPAENAMELLFEDHSASPYAVVLPPSQCFGSPSRQDAGRTDLRCLVYSEGPTLELEIPARYRRASRLPCLKPWSTR